MTPFESWRNDQSRSQDHGGNTNWSTRVRREYEEKADEADNRFREKQERELRDFWDKS